MSRPVVRSGRFSMSSPSHKRAGRAAAILIVVFAAVLLAGCGGSSSTGGSTQTVVVTSASTPHTTTTAHPGRVATTSTGATTPTGATKTSTGAAAPGSSHSTSSLPGGHLLRRFAGFGNTRLGTIVARRESVLVWNAQHPPIQIFTSSGFVLVNSMSPNGSIQLSGGSYQGVRVASHAGWSIELRSASS